MKPKDKADAHAMSAAHVRARPCPEPARSYSGPWLKADALKKALKATKALRGAWTAADAKEAAEALAVAAADAKEAAEALAVAAADPVVALARERVAAARAKVADRAEAALHATCVVAKVAAWVAAVPCLALLMAGIVWPMEAIPEPLLLLGLVLMVVGFGVGVVGGVMCLLLAWRVDVTDRAWRRAAARAAEAADAVEARRLALIAREAGFIWHDEVERLALIEEELGLSSRTTMGCW